MEKEGFSISVLQTTFFKGMTTMKKLTTLLLAAGMVFAASAPASAVDVKMDGEYMFTFGLGERVATGSNFDVAGQRLRLGMTFTANENLSGYMQLQAGIDQEANNGYDWGTDVTGRNSDVAVRQAYIDWIIPNTEIKVRMGKQLTGLPIDAFGKNAIMHPAWGGRDGISLTAPVTEWLDINAFWLRSAYEGFNSNNTDDSKKSDFFALSAPMKFEGFSITPYVMYAAIDKSTGTPELDEDSVLEGKPEWTLPGNSVPGSSDGGYLADGNAFWAGATASLTYFDPFVLKMSGAYGVVTYDGLGDKIDKATGDVTHPKYNDRDGWYVQAKASYKTAYGTPVLGAWYGSGDDRDVQYARQGWIPTNAGRFHPTFGYCAGEYGLYDTTTRHNIAGTWGVQAGIEDVSFLQDLSHKFTVTMWKGTNSDGNSATYSPVDYMTYSDTAVEFNLASTYSIYKNLTANLELAYIIADYDKDDHADWAKDGDWSENGWSAMLSFAYKF